MIHVDENRTKSEMDQINQEIEAELLEYLEEEEKREKEEPKKTSDVKFYITIAIVIIVVAFYKLSPIFSKAFSS